MITQSQFVRNVLLNWVAMLASLGVPFFLSPYTVHHLGNELYGIWVLVVSSVAYFQLLDLGLRSAITTFISKSRMLELHEESRRVVSTAVWLRIGLSVLIVLLAGVVALLFPRVFSIAAELQDRARLAIMLTALSLAINLASGVPSAVLAAQHRYDLLSLVNLLRTFFRAAGFVFLLRSGYGIVALAMWELAAAILMSIACTVLCAWTFPELRHFFRRPEREMMGTLWNYSAYVFLITIAGAIINYMDNGIVGFFLLPGAVTFYAIAGNLILSSREAVAAMSNTFVPIASGFEAGGKIQQLRRLLIRGTQASLLVSLPISIVLFVRGKTFIGLWMGPEYAEVSGTLLQILLLNQILTVANLASAGIVYGMAKHRPLAAWAMFEAIANLVLSVFLVRRLGVYGVAWGTAIAGVICNLAFWPRYMTKLLQLPAWNYLWRTWGCAATAAVPFVAACWYQEHHWSAVSLPAFFMQTAAILPVFLFSTVVVFWKDLAPHIPQRFQTAFGTD